MTPEKIRLLQFVTSFQIGGTERQVVLLGRNLDRQSFDLHLACLNRSGPFRDGVEGLGIPLVDYPIPSLHSFEAVRKCARFASYVRRHEIEIVHTYGLYPNLFAIPPARLARAPVIVSSIRDTGEWLTPMQKRVQRVVCRLADHVLVNAKAVVGRLVAEGYDAGRITVIENGVDLSRFAGRGDRGALRRELGLAPGTPLVAVICRMHNNLEGVDLKGVRFFLEAAAILARRFESVRFLIVGDGPQRGDMERLAMDLGLQNRVVFTGFRLDIPEILSEISVAVSPSLAEAISNSVVEAMAAGVPVVATRVGGNPEAIEDGQSGIIVPARDAEALARPIARLLEDPALASRMGEAARRRVAERFSMESMINATERVYRSLAEEARSRAGRRNTPRRQRSFPASQDPRTISMD